MKEIIKDFGKAIAWGSGLTISYLVIIGIILTIGICCTCFTIQLIIDGGKQTGAF